MEGPRKGTGPKQLNFRSYCLFCLQPQSPEFLFKLMQNNPKKIGSFQPLLHYLSGTDPTYDKSAAECASNNIPIMTNMPPMCQSCYTLLGDLQSFHKQLLYIQCQIKEQIVRIRKVVSDTAKPLLPLSNSAWKLFEMAIHSSEMPNEQIQAACKFVKDFQTLIMDNEGKKVRFPSKPPPNYIQLQQLQQPPVATTSTGTPQNFVQPNRNPIQIQPSPRFVQSKPTVLRIRKPPLTLRQQLLGQSQSGSVNSPTALSTAPTPVRLEQSSSFLQTPGEIPESEKSQAGLFQNNDPIYLSEQSPTTSCSASRHSLPCAPSMSTVVMMPTTTVALESENSDAEGATIADFEDDVKDEDEDEIKEEKSSDEMSESDIDTFSTHPAPNEADPLAPSSEDGLHINATSAETSSPLHQNQNNLTPNSVIKIAPKPLGMPCSIWSQMEGKWINVRKQDNVKVTKAKPKPRYVSAIEARERRLKRKQEFSINRTYSTQRTSKYKYTDNSKRPCRMFKKGGREQHGQICDLCGVIISVTDMLRHMETHVKDFVAICPNSPQCPLVFSCKLKMEKHLKSSPVCQKEGNYSINPTKKCPACDFETLSIFSLRKHFQIHEEEELIKPYACPIPDCTHSFAIRDNVEFHIFHQHDLRPPKTEQDCPICKKSVLHTKIVEHLEEMHKITETYKCKHCPVVFHTEVKRMEHLFKEHRIGIDGVACDLCDNDDLKFIRLESLRLHYFNVHKIGTQSLLVCEHCSQEFALSSALKCHINRVHMKIPKPGQSQDTEKEKSQNYQIQCFRCSICQIRCHSKESLLNHKAKFHGASISCKICNQKFENARQLTNHMNEHAGVPKPTFTCEVEGCDRTFRERKSLIKHKYLQHSSERPYICDTCGKGYVFEQDLSRHKDSVHLGLAIRPICEICGESFTSKQVLKRHKLIHTGERPYSCPICQQPFRCRTVMQTHIRSHESKGDSFKPNGPMKQIRKRVVRKAKAT